MIVFFVCGDSPHLAFMAVSHVYKKNSTRLKPLPLLIKFHCTYTHTLYHNAVMVVVSQKLCRKYLTHRVLNLGPGSRLDW